MQVVSQLDDAPVRIARHVVQVIRQDAEGVELDPMAIEQDGKHVFDELVEALARDVRTADTGADRADDRRGADRGDRPGRLGLAGVTMGRGVGDRLKMISISGCCPRALF